MDKYISIKEFADEAGVSVQAVYKRLNRDLKQFTEVKNGQKTISTEALKLFVTKPLSATIEVKENQDKQPEILNEVLNQLTNQLKIKDEQLKEKDQQIAEKDRQIAAKDRQLSEKDRQIRDLTNALLNEQHSSHQAHALHAGTIKQIETREHSIKPTFFGKWFKK